jgi:hypothetical protein
MDACARTLKIAFLLLILSCVTARSNGLDQVFRNPRPDPLWAAKFGSFFRTAKSYAVVIGISNYIGQKEGGYDPLPTSEDAEKMKRFLLDDQGFDYVRVLTDEKATKDKIEQIMTEEIPSLITDSDRFVFYYSGHGDKRVRTDNNKAFGFLPLYDSKRGHFASMISMDDIARWNGYISARHALFILDACLSGLAGAEGKGSISEARLDQLSQPSRYLITAGTSAEETIAGDRWGGSLFTYSLIEEVDKLSADSFIGVNALIDRIQKRVAIEALNANWNKTLTPQIRDLQGSDGAFFFVTRKSSSVGANPGQPANSPPPTPMGAPNVRVDPGTSRQAALPRPDVTPPVRQIALPPLLIVEALHRPGRILSLRDGVVSEIYARRREGNFYFGNGTLYSVAVGPKGDTYFADANGNHVFRLDPNGGETPVYTHSTYVRSVRFDPRGNLYFSEATGGGGDGTIYRLENGHATSFFAVRLADVEGYWAGTFAFDREGNLWLSSGNAVPSHIFKVVEDHPQKMYTSRGGPIEGMLFTRDGNLLYTQGHSILQLQIPGFSVSSVYSNDEVGGLIDIASAKFDE